VMYVLGDHMNSSVPTGTDVDGVSGLATFTFFSNSAGKIFATYTFVSDSTSRTRFSIELISLNSSRLRRPHSLTQL